MLQPILTLPSGTELKGGSPGSAVKSLTLHTAVNAGQEFTIGSAYSDYIEAEIWADPGGSLQITAGDALTYYRQDDAVILSILVDTFCSRISLSMPPIPKSHNTACVLS